MGAPLSLPCDGTGSLPATYNICATMALDGFRPLTNGGKATGWIKPLGDGNEILITTSQGTPGSDADIARPVWTMAVYDFESNPVQPSATGITLGIALMAARQEATHVKAEFCRLADLLFGGDCAHAGHGGVA